MKRALFATMILLIMSIAISCEKEKVTSKLEGKWWTHTELMELLNGNPSHYVTDLDVINSFFFEDGICRIKTFDLTLNKSLGERASSYSFNGKQISFTSSDLKGVVYDVIKLTDEELVLEAEEFFDKSLPQDLNRGSVVSTVNGIDIYFLNGVYWYYDKGGKPHQCVHSNDSWSDRGRMYFKAER